MTLNRPRPPYTVSSHMCLLLPLQRCYLLRLLLLESTRRKCLRNLGYKYEFAMETARWPTMPARPNRQKVYRNCGMALQRWMRMPSWGELPLAPQFYLQSLDLCFGQHVPIRLLYWMTVVCLLGIQYCTNVFEILNELAAIVQITSSFARRNMGT